MGALWAVAVLVFHISFVGSVVFNNVLLESSSQLLLLGDAVCVKGVTLVGLQRRRRFHWLFVR